MFAFIYDGSWKVWVGECCSAAQVYSGTGVDLGVISCQLVDSACLVLLSITMAGNKQ